MPVARISCKRIEPSRSPRLVAISPPSRSVKSVDPPPTSATSVSPRLAPCDSPSAWRTAETVKRLSSEVAMTSTFSPVAM